MSERASYHSWRGHIVFRCQCGATHRDRVYVGQDGALFINPQECERMKTKKAKSHSAKKRARKR